MGIGDLFGKKIVVCPECRTRGAVRTAFGRIRCRNHACRHYDESVSYEPPGPPEGSPVVRGTSQGTFDPGEDRISVRYRNFRGEDVEFMGDRRTIRSRKAHLSLRVMPAGRRIALWKKFIQNLDELERCARGGDTPGAEPTPLERQILGYHRKHHTTSPRFEALRHKYPHWNP